jgi:hypothetical protein
VKVRAPPDECSAAKKKVIVVSHGQRGPSSSQVILKEDFERWLDEALSTRKFANGSSAKHSSSERAPGR